ncbi:glycosyltransferase family 9 protein [Sphingomonas sp. KR1UV-12]|uniref:Glycosyltransferase family 9 protein n=1 Tax=Sphingomonas aurea TaxID=3063994 RepID=A0ABT9EM63_9SPHN|nr:glycosyltransferase family 9 protein [Sphingomonas sp. KR1UV-12]MDP1027728.1 glycosyltransferase family 9 protein [Sphingomonas sp. KR1UV-12]
MTPWIDAMRAGRFEAAWALERATIAARDPATRDDPALPYHQRWVWDGRAVDGREVLVRCYHGLGDTIQFARYLPVLAERARFVTLEVQPHLATLLAGLGVDRIVPFDPARPLPPAECDIEITELPCALGVSPADLAAPYIAHLPAALPPDTIGLCHRAGDWDPEREVSEALLQPLCARYDCLTLAAAPTRLPVLNPAGCPLDMAQTAALVAGVDLVVTVDTMIAHLAGAMGRPTWLLLKSEPDWRWSPCARDSAWYPTMRLYAQPRAGDWAAVLDDVIADLSILMPHRSSVPWPA